MILALAFATLQAPQAATSPSSSAPVQTPASAAPVQPYPGNLAEGLAQMQAVCEAGDRARALEIGAELFEPSSFARWRDEKSSGAGFTARALRAAEPVFEALDCNGLSAVERAAVHYALGVVQSREGKRQESADAFGRARELAGAGTLRLDAIYNLGVLALEQGEELRKSIPELNGGQPGAPATPPPAAPPTPGAASAPDPLEQAIQAYLHARTELLERLKADWQDADTRANVELVQRRLKELDELKKKREEEKQKQENKDQQQKDPKDKDKQDSKDQKDQDKQQQDQDKSKDDKDKSKDQKPDEKPPEDQQKPDQKPEDQPKPDEKQQDDKKQEAAQDPSDPQEKLLTKEEMMRLFEMLKQTEEQGKRLEQQLRQVRRAKVKKDW